MDVLKWQSIIIEWINCLKLSKPVVVIEDLKNEEFFKELLILLSKKDRSVSSLDTIQISDFLKKHYPAFVLENESAQMQDSVEITYAYSLLLHYCSLVDCSEEFIIPLCKDLCYMSQIFVKNFLEDLQLSSVITRDILKTTIYKLNKYVSTPTKSNTSSFNSPKTPVNTPLLEYLKTPYKKINEEIHKKEIKQMQAQLDLERFEKADLQEELNFQYEKNKKLDKNISENQAEIRRLRGEVLSLQNVSPPSNSKQVRNVENKRLRDEVVSLEKYVEILHQEQEELQTERDKARDKLRKMEETQNDLQNKYTSTEKQVNKLTEENKNYVQELFYLRERCEELSTMLHELNPKKPYDESYETDIFLNDSVYNKSGSIDSASLAQTVVDVQLVEAQTENKKLKTQLNELTTQLNQMDSELTKLINENQKLNELISIKTDENTELNEKRNEIESALNLTQKEKSNLIDELNVTMEMNKVVVDQLSNSETNNKILIKKFDQFNSDVNDCLNKFKINLNYDEDFPDDYNIIHKLSRLIQVFQIKNENNSKVILNLQDSCDSLSTQTAKLEEEIITLNLNEVETKREIDNLKINLKLAENKIEHYEKEVVTNYENLIDKYKTIIEEKCGMISELTKLKDVLINKDNKILKLQNEQKELNTELKKIQNELNLEQQNKKSLEKNCSNLENIINEKDNFIKSLELEKSNLQDSFDLLNEQLSTELKNLTDLKVLVTETGIKLENLVAEKMYLHEKINSLESDKNELNTKIIEKNSVLNDLNIRNQEYETEITILQNKHEILSINYQNLQLEIEEKITENNKLQNKLQETENKIHESESTKNKFETLYNQTKITLNEKINYINDLNNEKHELENSVDGLTNQLKSLEEDLSQEKLLKDELNNDLKNINEELIQEKSLKDKINNQFILSKQSHENETKSLCLKIEEKSNEIESLQKEIGSLNEHIQNINSEIYDITGMLSAENETVQRKEKTVENLKLHLTDLKSQISITLEEKYETMEQVKSYKQKIAYYKDQFETYKRELENVFQEINTQLIIEQNQIQPITLERLQKTFDKEQEIDKEILGEMLQKMIKLKENIYDLVFENHRVNNEINTLQKQYNILDSLKSEIETKLYAISDESYTKITELNGQLESLQIENEKYEAELTDYRNKFDNAHETLAEMQISVEGLIKKHKMEIDNYKESIGELKKKNTHLEEQVHHLKISEKNLTEELYTHQSKLQKLLQEYDSTVELNKDINYKNENEVKTLSNKLLKQTESFEQLQVSLSKTNLELESSLREIEMYKSLKEEFEKSLTTINKKHESITSDYESKIKKLKQENEKLKEQTDTLIKEHTKTKDKLSIEKTKQNDLDIRMKNFTKETEKLEENVLSLTEKIKYVENERQSLTIIHEEFKNKTNSMIQETKENHAEQIKKLQLEISKLNVELLTLNSKNEQFKDRIVAKETNIEKLREDNVNLQKTIDDLNDDKNVLTLKVQQLNEDLIKLKSCNDEKYQEKLDEINETKTQLSYTLNLIGNIYELLENELEKTSVELKKSENIKDENICSKIQNEIINIKTSIEVLLKKKHKLQTELDNITMKVSELVIKNNEQKLKHEQKNLEITEKNTENINILQTKNNEIIESLEKQLKNEKKTSQIYLKEVETLNTKLIDKMNEIEKISYNKNTLIKEYKIIANKISALKQSRNDLAEALKKITKEVEIYIIRTHESVDNIKKDFTNRLEEHEKERNNDAQLIKQLENFLEVEKNNKSFLETRLNDLTNEKEKLIHITSKSSTTIHELYNKIFEDSDVTEQINKIKHNQSEIEDELQSINFEQEIVDKEIELINNELIDLKKIRGEMSNYELVKSDYVSLKNKYNLMSVCETENNGYKLKISDLENKLTDLQNENTKYQKEINEFDTEYNKIKDEHRKEMNLMQSSYANWKKIAEDKDSEINALIEKYAAEMKQISDSNIELHKKLKELEENLYLNEELIYQEKLKNEDLNATNCKLERELEQQTQTNEKLISDGKTEIDIMNQKIIKYKNIITELEHENSEIKHQYNIILGDREEVVKLRNSYTNLMGENARLQLDCVVLKKTIDERNTQMGELTFIKESYEKLLEDNNKSHMELDTLRYKRNRDKEEFKKLLEEERNKGTTNADAQITEIRNEYEEKLKKMKEKMVNLYKEEMEREKKRITSKLSQSEDSIQSLKSQLWVVGNKNADLTKETEKLREQLKIMKKKIAEDFRGSRESMCSLKERRAICDTEDRRISTLPRDSRSFQRPPPHQVDIIEETVTVSRKRRSITGGGISSLDQGLKMEDEEGEMFNNTYLSDLKAGRCVDSARESVASSRLSELQYRNSLCPPHLKSSYPAETQFQSPGQFKEEELKMGTVDLDDSMSSSLLPGEKPRMKKDWGQTMYKKPGPPTPSKNGGRLSLQGNEIHPRDVLREQNENRTAGSRATSTPSRIKMLFSRSGHRNDSENISTPPKGKRRSIFRR